MPLTLVGPTVEREGAGAVMSVGAAARVRTLVGPTRRELTWQKKSYSNVYRSHHASDKAAAVKRGEITDQLYYTVLLESNL